jgi:negative regulator of replication initiation
MPKAPMKNRVIRMSEDLWQALLTAAAKNNESASDVLRRAAENYVRRNK